MNAMLRGGSADEDICRQALQPESEAPEPHGKRELTPTFRLVGAHVPTCTHGYIHAHMAMNTHKVRK